MCYTLTEYAMLLAASLVCKTGSKCVLSCIPQRQAHSAWEVYEKLQRLGIARAFLHEAPLLLLDEPTSNLDSLNEAVILKSVHDYRKDKTVILVSHRCSTMSIADETYSVENGRIS